MYMRILLITFCVLLMVAFAVFTIWGFMNTNRETMDWE